MPREPVHQGHTDHRDVEDENSTEMGDTGAKCLFPLLLGCNAEHRADDQNIREKDQDRVQACSRDDSDQAKGTVDLGV